MCTRSSDEMAAYQAFETNAKQTRVHDKWTVVPTLATVRDADALHLLRKKRDFLTYRSSN